MHMRKILNAVCWGLPLSFYALDANAWGLYTHVYFAQSLLLAAPLLDRRFRNAIKQFPELVMAGACLPDLAVISKRFNTTHQWQKAEYLIHHATSQAEMAIAIGYASHLYVDVIAHNHFVPAHEALWLNQSILTHIGSEWAMDAHVKAAIKLTPSQLLTEHTDLISQFIAPCFQQSPHLVKNKLLFLAYADRLLRLVRLPDLIHGIIQLRNNEKPTHFNYYVSETLSALSEFHKVLAGHRPDWEPELPTIDDLKRLGVWRHRCLEELTDNYAMPITYYSTSLLKD
ncbi:MAG: zinc dependent phospholipase C family protein [Methylophilaceae bacterium]